MPHNAEETEKDHTDHLRSQSSLVGSLMSISLIRLLFPFAFHCKHSPTADPRVPWVVCESLAADQDCTSNSMLIT